MKKTIAVYGTYAMFTILLLAVGLMMDMSARAYAMYILPILLILSVIPLKFDIGEGFVLSLLGYHFPEV